MKKLATFLNPIQKLLFLILILGVQNLEAGFWDRLFPGRRTGERLPFGNWVDEDYPGYCYGISRIESLFSRSSRKAQFNPDLPPDNAYEVERKMRLALNGEAVTFNGYRNLHDMSGSHRDLFKRLVKETSLTQLSQNDGKKTNTDIREIQKAAAKVAASEQNPLMMRDLLESKPHRISFCAKRALANGTIPCHSVKVLSAVEKSGAYTLKLQDPNYPGIRTMRVAKGPNGAMGTEASYVDGGWGSILIAGFDTMDDSELKVSKKNRYNRAPSSSASGTSSTGSHR